MAGIIGAEDDACLTSFVANMAAPPLVAITNDRRSNRLTIRHIEKKYKVQMV
jgi:hypothetical protein